MEKTYVNGVQDNRLEKMEDCLSTLQRQVNDELTHIKLDIATIKAKQTIEKWIVSGIISGLTGVVGFLLAKFV